MTVPEARSAPASKIAAWLGSLLAWLVGSVLRVRRAHVETSIARAGLARPAATAREMYRSLGRGLFELIGMALRPRRSLARCVRIDARVIELVERSERGVVVATAHTGNWDLVACAAAERVPLTVVTKRLSVGPLDRLWQRARAGRGIRLVSQGGAARECARALSGGQAVAMLIDQAPERARAVIQADFLGQPAQIDLAPALIAMRARAPLALVLARRLSDGSHVGELLGVLQPPARASRLWAEQATLSLTAWLEAFVRRHPEQWLWMHRRWKPHVVASEPRWPRTSPSAASP
jgi:Kdo2-lipid IVA lauroyltransferase/acyltransferase